jgi:hypothetical protein
VVTDLLSQAVDCSVVLHINGLRPTNNIIVARNYPLQNSAVKFFFLKQGKRLAIFINKEEVQSWPVY